MAQQLQQFYATEEITSIRYHHQGAFFPTEEAIRRQAIASNQVHLTYANGLEVFVNRHPDQAWQVTVAGRVHTLPPHGHLALLPGEMLQYSVLEAERRIDYSQGPRYVYANGGGVAHDFPRLRAAGSYVLRQDDAGLTLTPAPFAQAEDVSVDLAAGSKTEVATAGAWRVQALDQSGAILHDQPAVVRGGRWLCRVDEKAFAYRLVER